MPNIVFSSRELHPFGGGGIGVQVLANAAALARVADVTVLTTSIHEPEYRRLLRERPAEFPAHVRLEFVKEPRSQEIGDYFGFMHLYSARVYERLQELFPDGGPELVEFPDYLAEGLVAVQARQAKDPSLRRSLVCVRTHTSAEMCSVLDGHVGDDFEARWTFAAERYGLRNADRLIWPGGDVLGTYQRFYGGGNLAEPVRIRLAGAPWPRSGDRVVPQFEEGLRLIYLGRLERRKGVRELVQAVLGVPALDWKLTLVGADTDTAPLQTSMREQLELAANGDPRIEFREAMPREQLTDLILKHHVSLCPSRWECWPNAVLEALELGRPVVATPTGGLVEMVGDSQGGWLAGGCDATSLADTLEGVLEAPGRVAELISTGGPQRVFQRLTDTDELCQRYLVLAEDHARTASLDRRRASQTPLVSVVIPYFHLHRFVEDTLRSVFEQDYRPLEVIVVNDGSFAPDDGVLKDLATAYPIRVLTQQNAGLGAARNAGIEQSRGRYVLPVDADNMLRPSFVSRCVELLEQDRSIAFATTWSRYIDEDGLELEGMGYQPIGNEPSVVLEGNVAGDAAAVIRKRMFDLGLRYSRDLTSFEDWQLYRELHCRGHFGRVIPERLLLYRVRSDSMLREVGLQRTARLDGELRAMLQESQVEWEFKNV
jgi:glycogen synthase